MSDYGDLAVSLGATLYWTLDASTGVNDQSTGGTNDGTASGPTVGGHSATYPPLIDAASNTCTDFDGTDDLITSTYDPFVSGSQTFIGWAYRDASVSADALFAGSNTTTAPYIQLAGGSQNMVWEADASGVTGANWTAPWPGNTTWVFYALVYTDSTRASDLYINGSLVSSLTPTAAYSTSGDYQVGSRSGGTTNPFDGKMGHVAVFPTALSAGNISDLYTYAISGGPAGVSLPLAASDAVATTALVLSVPAEEVDVFPFKVRERSPLRLSMNLTTPSGRNYRWGMDEPVAANVPSPPAFSDTMPGGDESLSVTLPRKPGVDYSDLERLSTIELRGPGGGSPINSYRLEGVPRTSGTQMAVSPAATGWQAHLTDDSTASMVYVDRDLSNWQEASRAFDISILATYNVLAGFSVDPDVNSALPCLTLTHQTAASDASYVYASAFYDGGPGVTLASSYYDYVITNGTAAEQTLRLVSAADVDTGLAESSGDLFGTATGSGTYTPATARRVLYWEWFNTATYATDAERRVNIRRVQVYGNHGLTKRGSAPDQGFYASDVIAHAVSRWAPLLDYTTGTDGTIQGTTFSIPQLAFQESTTTAEIINEANRFHLNDWAVWGRTFYYHPRGARGRRWRARIAPAQLEETGPSVDRLWNACVVRYQDVDSTTLSVGPPGSGANTTTSSLLDTDPANPANQLGIRRWTILDMGIVSTVAAATQVGVRFLEESAALDSSGRATLNGYVEDDRGVLRPAWEVHAGDYISFVDASDSSYRRIIRRDFSGISAAIDIDAPPEGLSALLERLGVVLVGIL